MAADAQMPRPGDTIAGKYVLERLLGQGGMGAVFQARHRQLGRLRNGRGEYYAGERLVDRAVAERDRQRRGRRDLDWHRRRQQR